MGFVAPIADDCLSTGESAHDLIFVMPLAVVDPTSTIPRQQGDGEGMRGRGNRGYGGGNRGCYVPPF